ncbi:MAG TPA: hypothetical protein VND64_20090 [Pirellulales bacterium]|nr:hypothetical protein [Pirellulales bacterium]
MKQHAHQAGLPERDGLYDPAHEHDACGVGFVVNLHGEKARRVGQDRGAGAGPPMPTMVGRRSPKAILSHPTIANREIAILDRVKYKSRSDMFWQVGNLPHGEIGGKSR